MKDFKLNSIPEVASKFESYPEDIREKMLNLRQLVIETAAGDPDIEELEECLKWGEPSYLAKKGSTIRMDWKEKTPEQYAIYFKCTSKLVPTFKAVYGALFRYEKTRAILFDLEEAVPREELKDCIRLALNYHKLKNLPNLGKE